MTINSNAQLTLQYAKNMNINVPAHRQQMGVEHQQDFYANRPCQNLSSNVDRMIDFAKLPPAGYSRRLGNTCTPQQYVDQKKNLCFDALAFWRNRRPVPTGKETPAAYLFHVLQLI